MTLSELKYILNELLENNPNSCDWKIKRQLDVAFFRPIRWYSGDEWINYTPVCEVRANPEEKSIVIL